jgi:hypothetical protein
VQRDAHSGTVAMLLKVDHLVNGSSTDPAYFRARARTYRSCAGAAGDAVIHEELLRLARTYERMAVDAEIAHKASAADHGV